jgi:hypothetical protein
MSGHRRIITIVLLLGALALFVGLVARTLDGGSGAASANPGDIRTDSTAVPWLDAAVSPPYVRPVSPTPTIVPAGICATGDLEASFHFNQGAGGNWVYNLRVTSISSAPCSIPASYALTATSEDGPPVAATIPSGGGPITLRPGASAGAIITTPTEARCLESQGLSRGPLEPYYYGAVLEFQGMNWHFNLQTTGEKIYPYCGLHAGLLRPDPPPESPPPESNLQMNIVAPPTIRAGSTLVYTVELANRTGADVILDPCPTYVEGLEPITSPTAVPTASPADLSFAEKKRIALATETSRPSADPDARYQFAYSLNCAAASVVPASGSLQFAMQFVVPSDFPAGEAALTWNFVAVTGKNPYATVAVLR